MKKLILFFLVILIFHTLPPYAHAQAPDNIEPYRQCLGDDYRQLENHEKSFEALKNETFDGYQLQGWQPGEKFKSKAFEELCAANTGTSIVKFVYGITSFPAWLGPLCTTYNFGQGYNKVTNKAIMNGVSFMPDRGLNNIYRTYLRDNKDLCENPSILPEPTGYEVYLPPEAQRDAALIQLLMFRGWQQYCKKVNDTKQKIEDLKDLCISVPELIGMNLLDAGVKLNLFALKYSFEKPDEYRGDADKPHWEVYGQRPPSSTLLRRYVNNNVEVDIRRPLTGLKLDPVSWPNSKPDEKKPLKAEAIYRYGPPQDVTLLPETKWESSDHSIATVQNGEITIAKSARNGQEAIVTATYSSHGLSKSGKIKVKVKTEIELKEVILEPQDSTSLKTIDERRYIKAFAVFTDNSRKDVTKLKETEWNVDIGKGMAFFPEKGGLKVQAICTNSFTVTASYKTIKSKPLTYKIHPDYAFVPWAITRNRDVAVKMIKDNNLVPDPYEALSQDSNYSPGIVIDQDPSYCELVKKGTKVSININPDLSNKFTKVPDVIALSQKAAIDLLTKHRLVAIITHSQTYKKEVTITIGGKTVTRQIKPDHVLSQKPSADKTVNQGSEVDITINYGWETPMVKVPDLLGKTKDDAYSILPKLRLGLRDSLALSFDNNFNPGEIINQKPAKDKEVPVGTTVFVTINPSQQKLVEVPDLLCMTESKAQSTLSTLQLGIQTNLADSHDSRCSEGEIIEQDPHKGKLAAIGTAVKVLINPDSKASIGIKILLKDKMLPDNKRSFPLNTKLTFKEDVERKNTKKNTYTFKWYVDGIKISDKPSFTHIFNQPGSHYVMLDMFSSDPGENDTIRTNINIEYPDAKDMECDMTFDPPLKDDKKVYVEGDKIAFTQSCKNIKKTTEFRWYLNDRYVGSGKTLTHTFNEQGTYKVKLGLRKGSNYDESNCTKSITIGSSIGVLGNWRNRFKARGGLVNVSVCSEYWQGGYTPARWSPKCTEVSKIGPVDGYELCTGEQSDGYNTGFLVYSKKSSKKLNFQVYHFNFNKWLGFIHYSGEIPKAINPDPGSITLSCRANVADVRWTNEDGSTCSTKIWKFKHSNVIANYGVEQPTCSKSTIDPKKLKRCETYAKKAVEQFDENSNRKCNLQGPEWHGDEERHKQWCINVSQKEADDLTKHRDNALKNCGKTWCDSYAKRAVEQNEENIRNQCGFSGKRWQSDYNNHYNWCLSTSKSSADSETRERDKNLQNCIDGRKDPCKRYAEKAVKQNEQNIQKDCGFCGQRWQSSFDNHFQWCLEQPQSARDSEAKAREKLLNKCKDVLSAEKRTFYEPCYNGNRLDNCLNFGINCEEPAATRFCEEKGFTKATSWRLEKARPTYTIGDRSLCDDDFCAGFEYITCSGNKYPANNNPICTIKRPKSGTIIQPGKSVGFSADAKDPDRDKLTYAWVFEGGKPDKWKSFQGSAFAVKWNNPGSYTATLTVTDGKGGTCTDTIVITVLDKGDTLDCDQYADKSIQQNEENLSKKCGFTGDLWHSERSLHTQWCQNADQGRVAANIATREKALNGCKGAATITATSGARKLVCEISTPVKIAFVDAGKSVDFAGAAEGTASGNLAYSWKFGEYGAEPVTSTKQKPGKVKFKYGGNYTTTLTVTDAGGQTCQDTRHVLVYDSNDPREFCEGYSGISIEQNQANLGNGCGYSGEHWHNEELKHRKWCDSASLDEARNGLMERDEKLRQCTGKKVPVKTDNKVTPPQISGGAGAGSGTGATKGQQPVSLAGNWVGNGHNVSISQNAQNVKATALENKGPVGWKIAAGEVKGNTVYMNFNGQNLTGNISSQGKTISWSNNATWTRVPSGSGSVGQSSEPGGGANLVTNGSFEEGRSAGSSYLVIKPGSTDLPGWQITGKNVDVVGSAWKSSHGPRALDIHGTGPGGIRQSFPTTPGKVYRVSFDLAGNPWAGPQIKTLYVEIPGIVRKTFQFNTKSKNPQAMGWTQHSFTFRATQARSTVHFFGGGPPGNGAGPALDNVVVMADSGSGGGGGGPSQGTARLLTDKSTQDMVGSNEAFRGNGKYDATFRAQFSASNRTVAAVEVSNTNGIRSVWDTRPNNRLWLGGVVIEGRPMNRPDGSVNFSLGSGQNTLDFFVEDNGSIRAGKTNYRMTIFFSSGDPLIMDIVPANSSKTPAGTKHPLGDITKTTAPPTGGKIPVKDYKSIVGIPCGTDREFVYSMFQCILEKDPEKKEVDEQIHDFQSGMSRKDIVIRFFKSREYLNNNKSGRESYKDAFQAVLGRNPSSEEIRAFPRTWPFMMASGLFDTKEYRNLCPGNDDINKPGQGNGYNPLKDPGMGIPDKIQSKENLDALVKQYQDQQYQETKKDNVQKDGAVSDQSPDYTGAVTGNKSEPVEDKKITDEPHTGVINTPASGCSDNKQQAYKQYMNAYNQLTTLKAQSKDDTPAAKAAYKNFKFYKDCYEAVEKVPIAPAGH